MNSYRKSGETSIPNNFVRLNIHMNMRKHLDAILNLLESPKSDESLWLDAYCQTHGLSPESPNRKFRMVAKIAVTVDYDSLPERLAKRNTNAEWWQLDGVPGHSRYYEKQHINQIAIILAEHLRGSEHDVELFGFEYGLEEEMMESFCEYARETLKQQNQDWFELEEGTKDFFSIDQRVFGVGKSIVVTTDLSLTVK